MSAGDCSRCRDLIPELALGIADGDERAAVLAHLGRCPACRHELDALAATADAVLLAGPVIEPPAGFETAVLDRFSAERSTAPAGTPAATPPAPGPASALLGRRRLPVLAAAAAAVVFVLGLAAGSIGWGGGTGGDGNVRDGDLAGPSGRAGQVLAYTGDPSLLVVSLAADVPAGTYEVECEYAGGNRYVVGTIHQTGDQPDDPTGEGDQATSWSRAVDWPLDDLTRVRLLPEGGGEALEAEIDA
jgi:hypothetical protein